MKREFKYDRLQTGVRIQNQRRALHLTQETVAESVGLSPRMITDIERGASGMSIDSMLRICEVLKTSPDDILFERAQEDDADLQWLINALRNSSEETRACAIDIVRAYLRHN